MGSVYNAAMERDFALASIPSEIFCRMAPEFVAGEIEPGQSHMDL
jgi:hypothetical protein